jgi:putative endonuclease
MPWVYILECRVGSSYAGATPDADVRLFQHQEGIGSVYTARRRPVRLVFSEFTESIDEASRWERQIKGWRS